MTPIYAIATLVGVGGLIAWALLRGIRADGSYARFDPEARFGERGRMTVAGVTGFGLAGMSSTFAGWSTVLTVIAAVGGAALVAVIARSLGPEREAR